MSIFIKKREEDYHHYNISYFELSIIYQSKRENVFNPKKCYLAKRWKKTFQENVMFLREWHECEHNIIKLVIWPQNMIFSDDL